MWVNRGPRCWLFFMLLFVVVGFAPALLAADGAHPPHGADEQGADGGHEADGGHNADGKAADVPMGFKKDLAIWSFVVFLIIVTLLRKVAWQPLIAGLDKREGGIRQQIADAEASHEKAKALLAEHEYKMDKVQDEVRDILTEARRDADHTRNEMVTAAQAESEAMKDRAVQDIGRARDEALEQLFSHMSDGVVQAVEQVLGKSISDAESQKLIHDALTNFSPSNN